jgi:hypothetical protein
VALLWYPKTDAAIWTHTKLESGDVIYNTGGSGYLPEASKYKVLKISSWTKDRGVFRVKFRTTTEQREAMDQFLKDNIGFGENHGCLEGILKALDYTGIFHMPQPFRQVPTLTMLYLAALYQMGSPKIASIEYKGRGIAHSLLSPKVIADLLTVGVPSCTAPLAVVGVYRILTQR